MSSPLLLAYHFLCFFFLHGILLPKKLQLTFPKESWSDPPPSCDEFVELLFLFSSASLLFFGTSLVGIFFSFFSISSFFFFFSLRIFIFLFLFFWGAVYPVRLKGKIFFSLSFFLSSTIFFFAFFCPSPLAFSLLQPLLRCWCSLDSLLNIESRSSGNKEERAERSGVYKI